MTGYRTLGGGASGSGTGGLTDGFSIAITAPESLSLPADRQATPDASPNGHAGVLLGSSRGLPSLVASPFTGLTASNAISFPGPSGANTSGDSNGLCIGTLGPTDLVGTQSWTIEFRFKPSVVNTMFLVGQGTSAGTAPEHLNVIFGGGSGDKFQINIRDSTTGGNKQATGTTAFAANDMAVVVVTYDGVTAKLYTKKNAAATTQDASVAVGAVGSTDASVQWWIGRSGQELGSATHSPFPVEGLMDEIRISKDIVRYANAAAVDAVYNTGTPFTSDANTLVLLHCDAITSDAPTFAIALAQSDSNATPDEAATLGISGSGNNDTNATPTEARSALLRVWLANSAGAGVTNPSNANGSNNGTLATIQTVPAGASTVTMTSDIGTSIPAGVTFTSAILTVWFRARTTVSTSTAKIVAHSTTAAFADKTVFTQSTTNGDTNDLTTPLTYDLIANGIDTLAKLQSLQLVCSTTDVVAGTTPAILDVDAASADIVITSL